MKAGPKKAALLDPLPFVGAGKPSERFAQFCREYIRLGNDRPLILAPFQLDLVASVWDADPRPRFAAWALSRGSAKSTLSAALGVYVFVTGGDDTSVDCVAVDERQAGIVFGTAAKFINRHPELEARVQVFKDRLVIPDRAEFVCLPASPAALEGRNADLTICDEAGRIDQEVYEVVSLATGKKPASLVLLVGTPGPLPDNVLATARQSWAPDDPSRVYREIGAAAWPDHPPDCDDHGDGPGTGCITIANPAIAAGFAHRDGLISCLPPHMTEAHFRRTRLVQWVTGNSDPFVAPELWAAINTGLGVPDGAEVVLAFDGSFGGSHADTTALLVGTVDKTPHFDVVAVWESDGAPDWRVDVLDVEDEIRQACKRWKVRELVCDPFRWTRSMQVLAGEGITVAEFSQNPMRLTPATTDLYKAIVNARMTHSGNETLTRHVMAATVIETDKGLRLGKVSRSRSAAKIDLAACLVMAHSRATWLAMKRKPRYASFPA